MTWIAGCKDKNSVYLVADSAATMHPAMFDASRLETSWGQPVYQDLTQERSVQDTLLKLVKISDRIILGMAGDISAAVTVAKQFRSEVDRSARSTGIPISDLLHKAVNRISPNLNTVEFLVGYCDNDGPKLFVYQSGQVTESLSSAQIGSITNPRRAVCYVADNVMAASMQLDASRAGKQAVLVSVFNAFSYFTYAMLPLGVGGHFFGLSVSADGVDWEKDIQLSGAANAEHAPLMRLAERDNQIYVFSNFSSSHGTITGMICRNSANLPHISRTLSKDKWKILLKEFNIKHASYYAFLDPAGGKVSVFDYTERSNPNFLCTIKNIGSNVTDFEYRFSATALEFMEKRVPYRKNTYPLFVMLSEKKMQGFNAWFKDGTDTLLDDIS